jgi:DNA primase
MYLDYAQRVLTVQSRNGNEVMALCPFHDNRNSASLQFNVDKGLYNCFSCGATGNIRSLEKQQGVRFKGQEVEVADIIARLDALDAKPATTVEVLPESLLNRYRFPTPYWKGRGLADSTIKAFDLGYDPMNNIGIIPLRTTNGDLVAFIRRYLDDDADVKYKMPLKEKYSRSANLFASWLVAEDPRDEVVICEGPIDAMKVWQAGYPAVAQFGSSISYQQVRLLRRLGFNRAVLFYDRDKAGVRAAEGYIDPKGREHPGAIQMLRGFSLRRVAYEDTWVDENGWRIKDPGGLSDRIIRKAIRKAQEV